MSDKIILSTSDEAATFRTGIEGWVASDGRFFGNGKMAEDTARYAGCTHRPCVQCGEPAEKNYTSCEPCRKKNAQKRYDKLEKIDWNDSMGPMFSRVCDRYFESWDEVNDFCLDGGLSPVDMQLTTCKPIMLSTVKEDQWEDELGEDGELPKDVLEALADLNVIILEAGPVGWVPWNMAVVVPI